LALFSSRYMALESFWTKLTQITSSVFRREVKTPLSFYFRIALLVPLVVVALLFVPEPDSFKLRVLVMTMAFFALISALVGAFAWWRPKNLVYGESGHRAELKLEYGTEKRTFSQQEIERLEGVPAPKELGSTGE
jgi:hypothetical protein